MSTTPLFPFDIFDIAIEETVPELEYQGSFEIRGNCLDFTLSLRIESKLLDKVLGRMETVMSHESVTEFVSENIDYTISKNGNNISPEIAWLFLEPLCYAQSLIVDSRHKGLGTKRTFRVPLLAAEDKIHFETPDQLLNFILSLNYEVA